MKKFVRGEWRRGANFNSSFCSEGLFFYKPKAFFCVLCFAVCFDPERVANVPFGSYNKVSSAEVPLSLNKFI